MKSSHLPKLLSILLLATTGWGADAHAAKVDWSSQVGSPFFADTTDVAAIEVGGFRGGFVPTEENISEWSAHWVAVDSTQLNPTFRFFSGAVKTDSDLPADLAGTQGFIWLRQSEDSTGMLVSKADWIWPTGGSLLAAPIAWVADETATALGSLTASVSEETDDTVGGSDDGHSENSETRDGEIGGSDDGTVTDSETGDTSTDSSTSGPGRGRDSDTPRQRDFSGLMVDPDSGRVLGEVRRLTMFRGNAFTVRGRIGTEPVFFRGSTDGGDMSATSQRSGLTLNGSLDSEGGHINLEMRNAEGTVLARVDAAPAGAFGSIQRSTLLLLSGTTDENPEANGFGTLTVNPRGAARISGVLADGTRFAWTGVANDDQLSFYQPFADSGKSISGALRLRNLEGISDFDGQLDQVDGEGDASVRVQGIGSSYTADAGPAVLARIFGDTTSGELVIGETSFAIEWSADGLRFQGEGIEGNFQPENGLFSGTVGGTANFEGVLFEDQNSGGGQIRGLSGLSPISLRPRSASADSASE